MDPVDSRREGSVVVVSAPVAIISPFEQNYWDRFGANFVASIEALTVKPQEVILVTTARVDVPGHV